MYIQTQMTQEDTTEKCRGNTKSRHFCFTINNYTQTDIDTVKTFFDKYTFQEEQGSTKHLQGVGSFNNARSWNLVKKTLPKAHIEVCRNLKASIEYCSKSDTKIGQCWSTHIAVIKDPLAGKELYSWQKSILELIKTEPDDRKIHWFWDSKGNIGKTSFIKHALLHNKNATYIAGGTKDMLFAISTKLEENPNINTVFINIPRCVEHIGFNGIEQIKDGLIFNSKYESGYKMFNPPHIIIMANVEPDLMRMSEDRWVIKNLGEQGPIPAPVASAHFAGSLPTPPQVS